MSIKIGDMELYDVKELSGLLGMQEQYCLVKVGRIKLFGGLVKSLWEDTLSKEDRIEAALVGRRR